MIDYENELAASQQICEVGRRLYERGFVASNDGNITVRTGENTILITPTGVSKGDLHPDMLLRVDLDGNPVIFPYEQPPHGRPSIEMKMHLRVYRENPDVRAVLHAHPVAATSFAIAGVALDRRIYPQALAILGEKGVPCAGPYAPPGSQGIPDSIAPYCGRDSGYGAVLLANHGALTWGEDLHKAYFRMETLESFAQMTMNSVYIIGKANEISGL